jgi:hypothetical protein
LDLLDFELALLLCAVFAFDEDLREDEVLAQTGTDIRTAIEIKRPKNRENRKLHL